MAARLLLRYCYVMDTYSGHSVARLLGTNVPRLLRAARELGLDAGGKGSDAGSRWELTDADVAALRRRLGAVPVISGLSRVQTQVLAALARSPRGLLSARAVGRRAAVSPTAAGAAVTELERRKLIVREPATVALGRAQNVEVIRAAPGTREWRQIATQLVRVRLPERPEAPRAKRVPRELRHLFWNTDESQLDLPEAGGYVARRLLSTGDIDGLAWGADNLRAQDWYHAADTRGLAPDVKALALNLARAAT